MIFLIIEACFNVALSDILHTGTCVHEKRLKRVTKPIESILENETLR
jgi:hypothetical protein